MTAPAGADVAALPPVHTLTPESDFTRFFDAKAPVDDALKRAALKALLRDPRFNVMDGLDTYIDDYTRSDPIPEGVLQRLVQAHSFVTPSPTPECRRRRSLRWTRRSRPRPRRSCRRRIRPPPAPRAGLPARRAAKRDAPADAGKPTTT